MVILQEEQDLQSYYVNIYNSYLQTNQHSPGYYSDEVIEEKRIAAELATQVADIRDSGLAAGYEFNVSWSGYRTPQFMESLDGRTTFNHQEKGLLVLSGFQLLGYPNRYTIQEPNHQAPQIQYEEVLKMNQYILVQSHQVCFHH